MSEETPGGGQSVPDLVESLMRQLCEFGARREQAREACRSKYRQNEPEPRNRLRIMLDGLMAAMAGAVRTPISKITESSSYQVSVSASFIRTHFLVCDLIMDGEIVEAYTLVRKQLESLARLNELDSKPLAKLQGKTPNIQNALRGGAGRIYGDLSEIAHFSTPRVAEFLHVIENGPATGPSLLPVYSEQAVACMDLCQFVAIYFQFWMIAKIKEWYPSADHTDLVRALVVIGATALEAGIIRENENAPKKAN